MQKLIAILLLFSLFCNAQTFEFETIDKRTHIPDWEIQEIAGTITFTDSLIVIETSKKIELFTLINSHQYIRQNDKMFLCVNENNRAVNFRLCSDYKDKSYCELYYYSDEKGKKYYRYCLKKI